MLLQVEGAEVEVEPRIPSAKWHSNTVRKRLFFFCLKLIIGAIKQYWTWMLHRATLNANMMLALFYILPQKEIGTSRTLPLRLVSQMGTSHQIRSFYGGWGSVVKCFSALQVWARGAKTCAAEPRDSGFNLPPLPVLIWMSIVLARGTFKTPG